MKKGREDKDWNLEDCWDLQDSNGPNLSEPIMIKGNIISDIIKCRDLIIKDITTCDEYDVEQHKEVIRVVNIVNKRFGDLEISN